MEQILEKRVKSLVGENQLEQALDALIDAAQQQNEERSHILLILKGKLNLLEEQQLAGLLDLDEMMQEKAKIASAILKLCDWQPVVPSFSPLPKEAQVEISKRVTAPAAAVSPLKYILLGAALFAAIAALIFFMMKPGGGKAETSENHKPATDAAETPAKPETQEQTAPADPSADEELQVQDFPNFQKKFNFLDFQYDFRQVTATQYSDTEIKLTIQYQLTCRSNLGACYRAISRIYADENPIGPTYQKDLLGRYEHNASISDELAFVLPANARGYQIELSRDGSSWKRPFKILRK